MPLYGDLSIFNPAPPAAEEGGGEEGEKVLWGELEVVVEIYLSGFWFLV